jgi:hypothetical protein
MAKREIKGKAGEKEVDHLREDPVLYGQQYALVSFISPNDKVEQKTIHYLNRFLVDEVNKTLAAQAVQAMKKLRVDMRKRIEDKLDKLKHSLDVEDQHLYKLLNEAYRDMDFDEDEYTEECTRLYQVDQQELLDRYKMYLAQNRAKLNAEYDAAHNNEVSVRGVKIRGTYLTLEDAKARAKALRDMEPAHHIFVVPNGVWFPIDIEADEVQNQEHMLRELNDLMGKYYEGVNARNQHFQERTAEMQARPDTREEKARERMQKKLQEKRRARLQAEAAQVKELITPENSTPAETASSATATSIPVTETAASNVSSA